MIASLTSIALVASLTVVPSTLVSPDAESTALTRSEAAVTLLLLKNPNIPVAQRRRILFADVPTSDPLYLYLQGAYRTGLLLTDPGTNKIRPNGVVTRAEFLRMLAVTFDLLEGQPHSFSDVLPKSSTDRFAGIAASSPIFRLKNPFTLEPQKLVTKREALKAIRYLDALWNATDRDLSLVDRTVIESPTTSERPIVPSSKSSASSSSSRSPVSSSSQSSPLSTPSSSSSSSNSSVKSTSSFASAATLNIVTLRSQLLTLVNNERIKAGVPLLTLDDRLNTSAQRYALRMARENFFSHTAPDGETLTDRIGAVNYSVRLPGTNEAVTVLNGENIARGHETSAEVVKAWMLSPKHRNSILNPVFRDMGVGYASGHWVQHFGGTMR